MHTAVTLAFVFACLTPGHADTVSPLYARGYTMMPQPQVVKLDSSEFVFSTDWKLELQGVGPTDIAVQALKDELDRRFRLKLSDSGRAGTLRLILAPNLATVGKAQDRDRDILAQ